MTPSVNPDAALCELASAGDTKAFAALVLLHQGAVRNQLRRLAQGDLALADDLAQETFIQAWQHLAEFKGQSKLASWLYRIAYNRFLMHRRSQPAMTSTADQELVDSITDPSSNDAHRSALRLDVTAALGHLPETERIAMIHCYYLDLSNDEAAQVLGLPPGTLKSQLLRGKARLRELLAAWAPTT